MPTHSEPDLIVSGQEGKSEINLLAGALASVLREKGVCTMQAMGPSAVNKAVKAIIVAEGYVSAGGHEIENRPHFVTVLLDGEEKTAIRWNCKLFPKA